MSKSTLVALSLALVAAGCGKSSSKSPPAAPPTDAAAAAPTDAPPPPLPVDAAPVTTDDAGASPAAAWDDLTKEQHTDIMRNKVMPAMKTAFKGFDAKDFAKFNCKTCHGAGAIDKTFEMPNPGLPKLDFAALKAGKDAKMVKFMKEVVTPRVAEIIGEPVHDDAHPDGFGCLDCHVEKGK